MSKSKSIADTIRTYTKEVSATLAQLPIGSVQQIVETLEAALVNNKQVFLIGNGGSAATASHFACDLAKSTITPGRPRFKVIPLTDNMPLLSAWANDTAYENVFSE
ncbi:MAG: SIS domain-containing protein [Chloroflexi bacterium]|nr:SIS domain-containing protein [Chloroflexota bacterium]